MIFLRRCVKEGFLSAIPVQRRDLLYPEPKRPNRGKRLPTREQFEKIIVACPAGYREGFELMYDTGLRYEELVKLQDEDIEVLRQDPTIRYVAVQEKTLPDGTRWTPKSYGIRDIPVDDETIRVARAWVKWKQKISKPTWGPDYEQCWHCERSDRPHEGHGLCHACYQRLNRRRRQGSLMPDQLAQWNRRPVRPSIRWKRLDQVLQEACQQVGVKRITMHDFRRNRVTSLHQQGWTIEEIRDYIGHQSCATTERYLCMTGKAKVPRR